MQRIELALRHRSLEPSKLDRHVVEPAGRKPPIEMSQARDDDTHDRNRDVGPCLVEHEEIEPRALGNLDAGLGLLAGVELPELRAETRPHRGTAARKQIGMIAQLKWTFLGGRVAAAHEADREELVEL